MKNKIQILLTTFLLLTTLSTAELDFKTEGSINFHANQDLKNNNITNLNTQKFRNTGQNLIEIKGTGSQPHTLKFQDRSLQLTNKNQPVLLLRQDSSVQIPNGNLGLNENRLKNLGLPKDSKDAVRLEYVSGNFLNTSGDTMNGTLEMNNNNIALRNGYISNDGDNEGVKIDNSGNVEIPNGELKIKRYIKGNDGTIDLSGNPDIAINSSQGKIKLENGNKVSITSTKNNNVEVPNGNLAVSGTTDTVDLDNPGNAISINGNQYIIDTGAIASNELSNNAVTASGGELDSSTAGNQLSLNSGSIAVIEGSGSDLNADILDGVQLGNIDWSDVAMQKTDVSPGNVNLANLNPGTGISGNTYDGINSQTWTVDWSAADDLDNSGNVLWSNAAGLDTNGLPNDFSNAGDLKTNGDIKNGNIENAELSNSQLTVAGNTVSLGSSTNIKHSDLSSINYNNHHGLGDDLKWDSNNNPRLSNTVDVNRLETQNSFKFPVGTDAY
jgi:hypothetical protein